jgi:hypothetical protein
MSREILTKYRTKVIEDFIKLEGYGNTIISQYYLGRVSKDFFWEVLQDELFNFGLRSNILEKIFQHIAPEKKFKQLIEDLRRLSKIRNYFAHCNTAFFKRSEDDIENNVSPPEKSKDPINIETSYKEVEEEIKKMTKGGIPHPKKTNTFLDFKALYKEFEENAQKAEEQLVALMDKMGILFVYDTDTKDMTILFPKEIKPETEK